MVLLLIFGPPLVLGAFLLLIAVLFPIQGSGGTMLVLSSDWRTLLSLSVRIGLIPGAAVVIYRILGPRTRLDNKYSLAIFIAVMMVTVFGFAPLAGATIGRGRSQLSGRKSLLILGNDGSPGGQFRRNFDIRP